MCAVKRKQGESEAMQILRQRGVVFNEEYNDDGTSGQSKADLQYTNGKFLEVTHTKHNNAITNPESRKFNHLSESEQLEVAQEAREAYRRIISKNYPVKGNKYPGKSNELTDEGRDLFKQDTKMVKTFFGLDIQTGTESSEFKCDFPVITCSADNILREILVDKGQKFKDGNTELFIFVLDAEFECVEHLLGDVKNNRFAMAFLSAILESPFPAVYLCVWDFYNQAYFIHDAQLLVFRKEDDGLRWKKE